MSRTRLLHILSILETETNVSCGLTLQEICRILFERYPEEACSEQRVREDISILQTLSEEKLMAFELKHETGPHNQRRYKLYAHTREECEEKLKVLIQQLNAERKAIQDRLRGIPSPEKLTKKQRQIWEYMKIYPNETNYSAIAKGAKVTRHTVAKHYEMIQKMLGIQKTAPHPLLDCQTVPLMV